MQDSLAPSGLIIKFKCYHYSNAGNLVPLATRLERELKTSTKNQAWRCSINRAFFQREHERSTRIGKSVRCMSLAAFAGAAQEKRLVYNR